MALRMAFVGVSMTGVFAFATATTEAQRTRRRRQRARRDLSQPELPWGDNKNRSAFDARPIGPMTVNGTSASVSATLVLDLGVMAQGETPLRLGSSKDDDTRHPCLLKRGSWRDLTNTTSDKISYLK